MHDTPPGGVVIVRRATLRDRVVQTAVLSIIGPIFEEDLPAELHGYREGHCPQQAVEVCRRQADKALAAMRDIIQRLKLTVNENKTKACRAREEHRPTKEPANTIGPI